jgi:hypothetical protein
MNVIHLPTRSLSGGITDADSRLASRFLFARPGWHLAKRVNGQHGAYLEVTFSSTDHKGSLSWHLLRQKSGIVVADPGSSKVTGPYKSMRDAMLGLWEEVDAYSARGRSKPAVVLYGLDILSELNLQHLISDAGLDSRPASEPDQATALLTGSRVAAAIIDLHLPPQHCDAREAIRRMRQCRPGLAVLALTTFAPTTPEADLHGLGGPTHRERLPYDADAVSRWLRQAHDAYLAAEGKAESNRG